MTGPKQMTEKQLAANRANAQYSTGPRTPEGRAAVRYNALTHGILARAIVPEALAPYESAGDFAQLLTALHEGFAPASVMEELLVEQIAVAYWRLARLYRAEAGEIAAARKAPQRPPAPLAVLQHLALNEGRAGPTSTEPHEITRLEAYLTNKRELRAHMARYDETLRAASDEELLERAEHLLAELKAEQSAQERRQQALSSALRSLPPIDTALKFARYEAALQHQLDRALSRLERLQRLRGGEFVAPPLQVEVSSAVDGFVDD
jgi:hypothetical protein